MKNRILVLASIFLRSGGVVFLAFVGMNVLAMGLAALGPANDAEEIVGQESFGACDWASGGSVRTCALRVLEMGEHSVPAGEYYSSGTLLLFNSTCVSKQSVWGFHGAYYADDGSWAAEGVEIFRSMIGSRYPYVVGHLDAVRAFHRREFTVLTATELNRLGVPLCEAASR